MRLVTLLLTRALVLRELIMGTGRWADSTRSARLPKDWHKRKAAVRRRDGDVCWWCGRSGANEIDHKIRGDDHSLENLGPIHSSPCHKQKTAQEATAARLRFRMSRAPEKHPGML